MAREDSTEGLNQILEQRNGSHGPFSSQAQATQAIKGILNAYSGANPNWDDLNRDQADIMQEALDMVAHKLARIVSGDPLHADHWVDIAGYASLPPKFIKMK